MYGHLLLHDFVYYAYTILPLCLDQCLRVHLSSGLTDDISFESPDSEDFKSQPILSSRVITFLVSHKWWRLLAVIQCFHLHYPSTVLNERTRMLSKSYFRLDVSCPLRVFGIRDFRSLGSAGGKNPKEKLSE
jgi:hypothetical protein